MKIYDCFTFYNELDLLEARLNILDSRVDYFVLVESTRTHSGEEKELVFEKNKERFARFSKKIIHIVVDDMPEVRGNNRMASDNFQREAIMRGLSTCNAEDMILISDLDEIPNLEDIDGIRKTLTMHANKKERLYAFYYSLRKYIMAIRKKTKVVRLMKMVVVRFPIKSVKMVSFKQKLYYYYLNGFMCDDWFGTRAVLYGDLIDHYHSSPQEIRESSSKEIVEKGGWHFSYMFGPEEISRKIQTFAHSEFDKKEYTDVDAIKKRIRSGEDLFGRKEKVTYVKIDNTYPKWLLENMDKYGQYINRTYSDQTTKS